MQKQVLLISVQVRFEKPLYNPAPYTLRIKRKKMPMDKPFMSHENGSARGVVNDYIPGENFGNRGMTASSDSIPLNSLDWKALKHQTNETVFFIIQI